MKLIKNIGILSLAALSLASCTDGFEGVNSDPNKIYEVTYQSIFPGTVYRTMNAISALNQQRMFSYSRYVSAIAFQNAWSGSADVYKQLSIDVLRDLRALDNQYANDAANKNSYGAILTWEALVYYQMTSLYGPIIMSEAGYHGSDQKSFAFDDEAQAYTQVLEMLDKAYDCFDDKNGGELIQDPVYNGDVDKWRKLANTLRLEVAMNIQNIDENKAREYAAKSIEHEDELFASLDDQLSPKYGTVESADMSYYYNRYYKADLETNTRWDNIPSLNEYFATYLFSFNDPRLQVWFRPSGDVDATETPYLMPDIITRAHDCDVSNCTAENRALHLQWMIDGAEVRDSLRVRYHVPYVPTPDGLTSRRVFSWEFAYDETDPNHQLRVQDPLSATALQRCYIRPKYYAIDCEVPMLRTTDAYFLRAEAKVKFGLGSQSAEDLYNKGVATSFEENGISGSLAEYMAQDGIKWGTSHTGFDDTRRIYTAKIDGANGTDGQLEQIYKQRYFAGFLDGMNAWRLERRTRSLDFPPFFYAGGQHPEESAEEYCWPERLYFADVERENNSTEYYKAVENLQAKSKEPNDKRWGDNYYTLLQFAKLVPNKDAKLEYWKSLNYIDFNMDMQAKHYGKNWEEFLKVARTYSGVTQDDVEDDAAGLSALKKAFNFEIQSVIGTYKVGGAGEE